MSDAEKRQREWMIGTAQAIWDNKGEKPKGIAKFTATDYSSGWSRADRESVEVHVVFDPETKKWTAEVVQSWKGGF